MNSNPSPVIPPLAGLASYEEAARPGYSVEASVALLRRYNYVKTRLYQMSAAFMNPTPEWEVKGALSLHLYLDGEHSQMLRQRVAELRLPPLRLDEPPDPHLSAFLDEALRAENTVERLTGLFRVIRPALLAAYRTHLAETNPVFDFPTCRMLKIVISEEEQMIQWGEQALAALLCDIEAQATATAWEQHLRAYLQAASGITGEEIPRTPNTEHLNTRERGKEGKREEKIPNTQYPIPEYLNTDYPSPILPVPRAVGTFQPDLDPRRDARSGDIYNFHYRASDVYRDSEAAPDERVLALMYKRFHEMDVPEMMASIVLQTEGKPWEYFRDMGRQLWDEARHSMMGEVWFVAHQIDWSRYPNHVGWSLHLNLDRTPLERHIVLYGIEQNLMDGKRGKRNEWLVAQEGGDPLATYLQDYDWADEVLHAQIGRRWLKPEVGDVKTLLERAAEISSRPSPILKARAQNSPQIDWWPQFVRDVLGKESVSHAGEQSPQSPTYRASASG